MPATRSPQCRNCLCIKWLGLGTLSATPFPSLCGISPPIRFPHNERIGDPDGSRPFLPLWITSAPLELIHNERFGVPGGSRPFHRAPRSPLWVINNARLGHLHASGAIPSIVRQPSPHGLAAKGPDCHPELVEGSLKGLALQDLRALRHVLGSVRQWAAVCSASILLAPRSRLEGGATNCRTGPRPPQQTSARGPKGFTHNLWVPQYRGPSSAGHHACTEIQGATASRSSVTAYVSPGGPGTLPHIGSTSRNRPRGGSGRCCRWGRWRTAEMTRPLASAVSASAHAIRARHLKPHHS
jgi:hypothetical protein